MMVATAQAGLISLNCFLPGSDGRPAARTHPEEALIMRKRLFVGRGDMQEVAEGLRHSFSSLLVLGQRQGLLQGPGWKFSSESVVMGLRTTGPVF